MMKLDVIIFGIKSKLKKGQSLEEILKSYIKLTVEEKDYIRKKIGGESVEN